MKNFYYWASFLCGFWSFGPGGQPNSTELENGPIIKIFHFSKFFPQIKKSLLWFEKTQLLGKIKFFGYLHNFCSTGTWGDPKNVPQKIY